MTQWHDFLRAQGAVFQDSELQSFGSAQNEIAAANGTIITSLSHLGLLEISGEDAVTFLQGQVTNDVKKLDGSVSQYAGYCSPKGRLLALFLAFAHADHLHLQMPLSILEPIMKRLKMFVMRSKVVITDKSTDILCFGIAGPNAKGVLTNLFNTVPQSPQQLITHDDATLLRLAGDSPRYQVFTHTENAERIWTTLSANCTKVGKSVWDYLEIQAGIPEIVPATQEAFVPQMVNLDALDGINFKKGCYIGQELTARTHYRALIKKRLMPVTIAGATPLPGEALTLDGKDAGEMKSAAGANGLALVRLDAWKSGGSLTAGDTRITPVKPDWMQLPQEQ
jgi:folate-binding protein YgfZ